MSKMKCYVCTDHSSFWPVGSASVVVAKDCEQAQDLLDVELVKIGLEPYGDSPYDLVEIDLSTPKAIVLDNGEY